MNNMDSVYISQKEIRWCNLTDQVYVCSSLQLNNKCITIICFFHLTPCRGGSSLLVLLSQEFTDEVIKLHARRACESPPKTALTQLGVWGRWEFPNGVWGETPETNANLEVLSSKTPFLMSINQLVQYSTCCNMQHTTLHITCITCETLLNVVKNGIKKFCKKKKK